VNITYTISDVSVSKTVIVRIVDKPVIKMPAKLTVSTYSSTFIEPQCFPLNGKAEWSAGSTGFVIKDSATAYKPAVGSISLKVQNTAKGIITLSYTACGKTVTHPVEVTVVVPKKDPNAFFLEVPDKLIVMPGKKLEILPDFGPLDGQFNWVDTGGIKILTKSNDKKCIIEGVKEGKARIAVTLAKDGEYITKQIEVQVGVTFHTTTLETGGLKSEPLKKGSDGVYITCANTGFGFTAYGTPHINYKYTYEVSGNGIEKYYQKEVDKPYPYSNAMFRAEKAGDYTIKVTFTNEGVSKSETIKVKVIDVKKIEITADNKNAVVKDGTKVTFTAKVTGTDDKDITDLLTVHWSLWTDDPNSKDEGNYGRYEGKTCSVTLKSANGKETRIDAAAYVRCGVPGPKDDYLGLRFNHSNHIEFKVKP
jgi:hypothetical protein